MWIFYDALESLRTMPLIGVAWWVLIENILIFFLALIIGELLLRVYHDKLVAEPAPPDP